MEIPERLREQFYQVTRERIEQLGPMLDALMETPTDRSSYESVFQIFHKIHGSAAIYGHEKLGDIAGMIEGLIYSAIQDNVVLDLLVIELMVEIKECLTKVVGGAECDESTYQHIRTRVDELAKRGE